MVAEPGVYNNWNDPQIQDLYKNINWLNNQLELSKTDSISIGLNLTDSIVQVQLKGTVMFQSKILQQHPQRFLTELAPDVYFSLFGRIYTIEQELASIVKKPIKKVKPGAAADTVLTAIPVKPEEPKKFYWDFIPANEIRVVIFGVPLDSDSSRILKKQADLQMFSLKQALKKEHAYTPTLFIWLNEQEARSIYRALPEKAKIIFRN